MTTVIIDIEHDCEDRENLVEAILGTLVGQEYSYECQHSDRTVCADFVIASVACEGGHATVGATDVGQ